MDEGEEVVFEVDILLLEVVFVDEVDFVVEDVVVELDGGVAGPPHALTEFDVSVNGNSTVTVSSLALHSPLGSLLGMDDDQNFACPTVPVREGTQA